MCIPGLLSAGQLFLDYSWSSVPALISLQSSNFQGLYGPWQVRITTRSVVLVIVFFLFHCTLWIQTNKAEICFYCHCVQVYNAFFKKKEKRNTPFSHQPTYPGSPATSTKWKLSFRIWQCVGVSSAISREWSTQLHWTFVKNTPKGAHWKG